MVNYEYPPLGGGGGVVTAQMAEAFAKRGHQVQVLTSRYHTSPTFEVAHRVAIHRTKVLFRRRLDVASQLSMYSFLPGGVWKGLRSITPDDVDIINTHFAIPSGPTGILLSRRWQKPHILTVHGGDIYDPSKRLSPHRIPPLRALVRWVLNHSDCVTTFFQDIADRSRQIYSYSGRLEMIPYGLPARSYPAADRSRFGWKPDEVILISVARLIPRKGFVYLLEALARLKDRPWRWIALGSGPLLDSLQAQAAACGIQNKVEFRGHVDEEEKYARLASADVFVLPSLHEGFGVVNLEAMTLGLPIITTSIGGQVDFLKEGYNALLVPPADSLALCNALRRMLTDSALRRTLGSHNRNDIQSRTQDIMMDHFEELFERIRSEAKP